MVRIPSGRRNRAVGRLGEERKEDVRRHKGEEGFETILQKRCSYQAGQK